MNENLENKVCLVTGATNGIGLEAAKALNQMGAEIVFVARNIEKAEKLYLKSFNLKSDYLIVNINLAILYQNIGNFEVLWLPFFTKFCQ